MSKDKGQAEDSALTKNGARGQSVSAGRHWHWQSRLNVLVHVGSAGSGRGFVDSCKVAFYLFLISVHAAAESVCMPFITFSSMAGNP